MNRKVKSRGAIIFVFFVCFVIMLITGVGLYKTYQKDKQQERETYYPIVADSLNYYGGTYTFVDGKIKTEGCEFKYPVKTLIAICHYNYFEDENITYEKLVEEFDNFCLGKGSYRNLLKYAQHYDKFKTVMVRELNVNNIGISQLEKQVYNYLKEDRGYTSPFNEEFLNLSMGEVEPICDMLLQNQNSLYLSVLVEETLERCSLEYPMLYCEFDENQIKTDETGNKYVSANEDNEIYYLELGNVDFDPDDEWYVSKVEIYGGEKTSIFCIQVGMDKERASFVLDTQVVEGLDFVSEDEETIVYDLNTFRATAKFRDGVCCKVTLEIME